MSIILKFKCIINIMRDEYLSLVSTNLLIFNLKYLFAFILRNSEYCFGVSKLQRCVCFAKTKCLISLNL